MKITGRFDSDTQARLSLSIERCREDCKSEEDIDNFLNTANVAVYFTNFAQQLNSPGEPYEKVIEGLFSSVDSAFSKTNEIFMKKSSVKSNKGFIVPSVTQKNYHLMDRQKETVSSSRNGSLYNLIIQMSTVEELHSRTSKKITTVLATMGGYLKAILILYYVYKPFLERKYFIELINHMYNVEQDKIKQENKSGSEKDKENEKQYKRRDTKLTSNGLGTKRMTIFNKLFGWNK